MQRITRRRRRHPFQIARFSSLTAIGIAVCGFIFAESILFPNSALSQYRPDTSSAAATKSPEQSLANGAARSSAVRNAGQADIKHGEEIMLGKASCSPGKVCGCFQCHQVAGQGNPISGFPRIGGQSFQYLYAALRNFKSGRRVNSIMQPIAAGYSDEDLRDVAAYYASIRMKPLATSRAAAARIHPSSDTLIKGGALAAVGSAKDGVQACANCHGPAGAGLPPVYPFLAGQFAGYLESQLKAFKSDQRRGDGLHIMQDIAKRLSDEQIHAVAAYYASIQPPKTIAQTSFAGPAVIGAPLGPLQEGSHPNGSSASAGQGSGQ